jgi:hypothetical protein
MTKIANKQTAYTIKSPLSGNDYFPISDSEVSNKKTRSADFYGVREFVIAGMSPIAGGELKFTEIEYNGVLTTPSDVANAINPAYQVAQYEFVVFNINGDKYILKLQDVTIGVGQTAVANSDFINLIGFTKLGDGTNVLKGYNTSTKKQEFYAIKSTGNDISLVSNNIVIDPKAGTNLGATGQAIYKGLEATTKIHEFYKIDSDDFVITLDSNIVKINNPVISDSPRFYVNSGYDIGGTAPQTGSPSKPYKTIQGAIDAYINASEGGTAQNPQNINGDIIIQKGVGYTFTGSFAINTGTGSIIFDEGCSVLSSPASGDWLCDYDTLSTTASAILNIVLNANSTITLSKSGFRNKGTSINNGAFTDAKQINISGQGMIYQSTNDAVTIAYTIIESNYVTTDTFKNDSASTFNITGTQLFALTQQIYKVGGNSTLIFENANLKSGIPSVNTNVALKAFEQIGGQVRRISCSIDVVNNSTRTTVFSMTKNSAIPCQLFTIDEFIQGNCVTLFQNENANQSDVNVKNTKTLFFTCTNIAKSPSVLWTGCGIFNSIIQDGAVDFTQVDLTIANTISAYNIFNNNSVEILRVFGSRALAVAGGLIKYDKFINRKTITAGAFVVGTEYQILTVGTTNFTLIGAASNTVGLNFTATGVGTGTGTAYQYELDVII